MVENEGNQDNKGAIGTSSDALSALAGLSFPEEITSGLSDIGKTPEPEAGQQPQTSVFEQNQQPAALQPEAGGGQQQQVPEVQQNQQSAQQPEGGQQQQPEGGQQSPEGQQENTPQAGTLDADFKIDSPLYGGEKKFGQPNEAAGSETDHYKSIDSLSAHLKSEYGIDDVNSLGSELEKLRADQDAYNKLTVQNSNVERLFGSMPPELYKAVERFSNGEDWKQGLQNGSIDYTKDVTSFKGEELVNAMRQGNLTSDDWEQFNDPDGDPAVKRLVQSEIDNAKREFTSKQVSFQEESARMVRDAQTKQQNLTNSISAAREHFVSVHGDASKDYVDNLQNVFSSGNIASLFYNNDGTLKQEAFINLAMAQDGAGLVDQYKTQLERKIETKYNQELLARTQAVPTTSKGSQATTQKEGIRPEVQAEIDAIKSIVGQ